MRKEGGSTYKLEEAAKEQRRMDKATLTEAKELEEVEDTEERAERHKTMAEATVTKKNVEKQCWIAAAGLKVRRNAAKAAGTLATAAKLLEMVATGKDAFTKKGVPPA